MSTYPMAPVDAAWYHIDGPANLAVVNGVLLTRTPLDFEAVRDVYRTRLSRFPRFRRRVVETGLPMPTPHWQDIPGFDLGQQVHHVPLPAPGGRAAFTALLDDLASAPLDHAQPLWQVHVIDDVEGGSALVMRFHHCIGDGTAMMALAQELFDTTPDAPLGREAPPEPRRLDAGFLDSLVAPALGAIDWSARALATTVASAVDALKDPSQVVEKVGVALDAAGMLIGELLRAPDPPSPLKGPFGQRKRTAWSEPVALDDVKAIGAPVGAKINDVLVATVTGALRQYLAGRGVDVDHTSVRAMVPVDLRPPGRGLELGNAFGLVILPLPIGQANGAERLRRAKANMDALKRSPEAVAIMTLFNIFGRGPKAIEDLAVDLFSSRASLVMTNVAGPRHTIYLAGVPIESIMFWVPHPGRQLGMGVSILSYRGFVSVGVIADAHLVPDPEAVAQGFNGEFARMLAGVRQPAPPARAPARRPRRRRPARLGQ